MRGLTTPRRLALPPDGPQTLRSMINLCAGFQRLACRCCHTMIASDANNNTRRRVAESFIRAKPSGFHTSMHVITERTRSYRQRFTDAELTLRA